MSMGPWTQAAKSLVNATFGDPAMRGELAKNEREAELFGARTDAARASANSENLQAKLREQELNALNRYSVDYANLFKPVEERAYALPEGVEGPQGPMMQRPPGLNDFQERLPNFLQTSIQAGASPADLGKLLQGMEGAFQSQGVTDFDERQRAIAFGAGNPFSTDELDAQNRANLPQGLQNALASAVPSDQVFGGALLDQLDPSELVSEYRTNQLPSNIRAAQAVQADPSLGETIRTNNLSGGTTVNVGTGADGTPNSPLTTSQQGGAQENVMRAEGALQAIDDAIATLEAENQALESGERNVTTGGFLGSAIAPGSSDSPILKTANGAIDIVRALPGGKTLFGELTGATPEEVRAVRQARLKIQDAAVALERRIANGALSGQYTQQDARDARSATRTINVGGDNDEIIAQFQVLKEIAQREREINQRALREGVDISGPNAVQNNNAPLVTTQDQYDALPSGTEYMEEPGGPVFVKP